MNAGRPPHDRVREAMVANAAQGPEQIISLPSGGGAVRGIGETFAADPQTGTARQSVPIVVPDGRRGFAPHLQLDYSSGNGNGHFGLGWTLSVPGISRRTARGVPLYDDDRDVFVHLREPGSGGAASTLRSVVGGVGLIMTVRDMVVWAAELEQGFVTTPLGPIQTSDKYVPVGGRHLECVPEGCFTVDGRGVVLDWRI